MKKKLPKGILLRGTKLYIRYYDPVQKRSAMESTGLDLSEGNIIVAKRIREDRIYQTKRPEYYETVISTLKLENGISEFFRLNTYSERTRELYSIAIKHFVGVTGNLHLHEYSIKHSKRFNVYLNKYAANTQSIYTRSIHHLFSFFVEMEYIPSNPIIVIRGIKKKPVKIPQSDLQELLAYMKSNNTNAYNVTMFFLLSGFRPHEVVELKWKDIDFEGNRIFVSGKNRKRGEIDELPMLQQMKELLTSIERGDEYVFPYRSRYSFRFFRRHQIKLWGKQKYTPYQLRKTFITNLLEQGHSITDVKILARHSRIELTYDHYYEADLDRIVKNTKLVL